MDAVWRIVVGAWTGLVALIVSRTALAVAHLYGWHPEQALAGWVVAINRRFGDLIGRVFVRFAKPPVIPDAPGLVWKRLKGGWQANWIARPELVKRGYPVKRLRLAFGEKFTPIQMKFISTRCIEQQHDMLKFERSLPYVSTNRKRQDQEPSMAEILQSIRQIIADDDLANGKGETRLPLA